MKTTSAAAGERVVSEVRDAVVAAVGVGLEAAALGVRTAPVSEAGDPRARTALIIMTIRAAPLGARARVVARAVVVVVGRAVGPGLKRGTSRMMSRARGRVRTLVNDEGATVRRRAAPGLAPGGAIVDRVGQAGRDPPRDPGLVVVRVLEGGIVTDTITRNIIRSIIRSTASIVTTVAVIERSIGTTMTVN